MMTMMAMRGVGVGMGFRVSVGGIRGFRSHLYEGG